MATSTIYDVLILGGGPGGLAVANSLARQLYTALVFDTGVFRNARTEHMHNVLGWDHQDPAAFRAKAKSDILAHYNTISFQENTTVSSLAKLSNGHFEATSSTGQKWLGRKVVIATGITDVAPDIEGYDECWGRGIFHCLFCHGYEERDSVSAGVLAIGDVGNAHMAIHLSRMAKRLSKNVVIYTHGDQALADDINEKMQNSVTGITADSRKISKLVKGAHRADVEMHFEDGSVEVKGFIAHRPKARLNGPFAEQLGIELTEQGLYKVAAPFPETSVKGVFAVGDCSTMMGAVAVAMYHGTLTGAGLAFQLQEEPF